MITQIFIGLIILLSVLWHITIKRRKIRIETLINKFPGPRAYPIIGNLPTFLGSATDVLRKGRRIFKHDSPARIWLMHKPVIFIFDPENFQTVSNIALHKGEGYAFFKDFLGEGLITANGGKWKKNRRLLNPAFNPHLLHKYFLDTFHDENDRLIKALQKYAGKEIQFDLWPYVIHSAINTVSLSAMNYRDELENNAFKYGESILKASILVSQRVYKPWLHSELIYNIYKRFKGYHKVLDHIHALPKTIIEKKRKDFENVQKSGHEVKLNGTENTAGKRAQTFIDILLGSSESKNHFSDDQLADEIVTVIMAGSETTAITVCFTLLMLAVNQHYQDQVYEEIQTVLGNYSRKVENHHLNQLTFLEQCIKETMRLFSAVPFIFRHITEDIQLKDGRIIPAGVTVCLAIAMLHNNPKVYPNPMTWNPNNFTAEAMASRHQCSFVPFSSGPRSCIGAKYAMLSMKVMLVTILRRFKFYTDTTMKEFKMSFDMMLRNTRGYPVRLEER
ncbi:cytochrome P450 4g15-like [Planococcus citri]|uniref:cytochrome P450 4g15-like n=1 Tax=Planococcus citri TaxID=170843 RepID=UPI0031F853C8